MIDSEVRQRLEEIVEARVKAGDEFTAFDVTRELRTEGWTVVHGEAKEVVHQLYFDGKMPGYTRELRDVGGPVAAFVYYPLVNSGGSTDADDDQVAVPAGNVPSHLAPSSVRRYGTPTVPAAPPTGGVAITANTLVKRPNSRGGLLIPARITRGIGAQPGDRVYVNRTVDGLEIVPTGMATTCFRYYRVDRRCNIRIPKRTQELAGISTAPQREIELDQKRIVVRAG